MNELESAIKAHVAISQEISDLEEATAVKIRPLQESLKKLEHYIGSQLPDGPVKVTTPHGAVERKVMQSVSVSDWDTFLVKATTEAIQTVYPDIDHDLELHLLSALATIGPFAFIKHDVAKAPCMAYMTKHAKLPDGLALYSRFNLTIKPAKTKGYANE